MIFVDSNVVIDLIEYNSRWSPWSREEISKGIAGDILVADAIVLAECGAHFASLEEGLGYFEAMGIALKTIPVAAAWRAGRAHRHYRRSGGEREAILADFLIAGHASVLDAKLLTRDRRRFASYFPELTLITPENDHG
jgi:predicted nucleic acid-binding protein